MFLSNCLGINNNFSDHRKIGFQVGVLFSLNIFLITMIFCTGEPDYQNLFVRILVLSSKRVQEKLTLEMES
jgi:hypothetical protein